MEQKFCQAAVCLLLWVISAQILTAAKARTIAATATKEVFFSKIST